MEYIGTTINQSPVITLKASAKLEDIQGKAVAVSDGKAAFPEAGANAIGIALFTNDATVEAGADVQIQIKDIGKIVAAEAIAVGDEVSVDATGKAVKAASGKFIVGTALTASSGASASGTIIQIQITKSGYKS